MPPCWLVQAQKEDAARLEIALDLIGDRTDVISDVDIAVGADGAVNDVLGVAWRRHVLSG